MSDEGSATGLLHVTSRQDSGTAVLTVTGELDYLTADALGQHITGSLGHRPEVLVLDLTGVRFMDSMGMSLFLGAQRDAHPHTSLRIVPGVAVLRSLQIAGLDQHLPLRTDLDTALA